MAKASFTIDHGEQLTLKLQAKKEGQYCLEIGSLSLQVTFLHLLNTKCPIPLENKGLEMKGSAKDLSKEGRHRLQL